jgi:hypothetical protein
VRAGWGLLLLGVTVVTGGCRVDAFVDIDVASDGGAVTTRFVLDREAVALLGGKAAEAAHKSDLEQAGWEISPVEHQADGRAEIEATKQFHRAADLAVVVNELAGPAGPLRGFRLDRDGSLLKTRLRVSGTVDLGPGGRAASGLANSPELPARLRDAGVDPDRVQDLLAGRAADGLALHLGVTLPGASRSWTVEPGGPARTVDLASSVDHRVRPALLVVAVALAGIVVWRTRRRSTHS